MSPLWLLLRSISKASCKLLSLESFVTDRDSKIAFDVNCGTRRLLFTVHS